MSQLVFHISGHGHRLGNLVMQQLPVTLPQSMECLFHRVFRHTKLGRCLGL